MGELFGLGILLTLQDRASRGVQNASSNLEELERQTRETINAVTDLERANTGLSSSNPSMTLTDMASSMRQYTYYYDQYGRRHRYHSNQFNRELMRMTGSANDMAQSLESSIRPWGQFAGMTSSGRQVASMMQGIARETQTAQRALLGFNAEGTHAITQEQTTQALERYRNTINDTQASLHGMYQRGEIDALSYQTAVRNMAQESRQIERINQRGFRTTSQYYSMMQQAGIATNAIENMRGIALERNRSRIQAQARTLLETKTSAMKFTQVLQRTNPVIGAMTSSFTGVAGAIQQASKAFDPLVIQARLFNQGFSGKEVADYMMAMQSFADGFVTLFPTLALGVGAYYTALGALAYKQVPAVSKSFDRLKGTALQALKPLIKVVAEVMVKVMDLANKVLESVTAFEKAHPIITRIATALALIVPIATLVVGAFLAIKTAGGFIWTSIVANITQAGGSVMGLAEAVSFFVGIATTVTAVVGIFLTLYHNCEWFRESVNKAIKSVKEFVNEFKKAHPTITAFFDSFGIGLLTAMTAFNTLKTFKTLGSTVFSPLTGRLGFVGRAFQRLGGIGRAVGSRIGTAFTLLRHPIAGVQLLAFDMFNGIRNLGTRAFTAVSNRATWFGARALGAVRRPIAGARRLGSSIMQIGTNFRQTGSVVGLFRDTANLALRGVRASVRLLGSSVRWLGTMFLHPISSIRALGSSIAGLWRTLGTRLGFSPWIIAIAVLVASIMALWKTNENFRNGVMKIWKAISSFVTQVINGVREAMDGKLKPVIENLKSIMQSLGTIFGTIFSAIGSVLSVFFGDITGGFKKSGSAVETVTNLIVSGLTGAINILNAVLTPLASLLQEVAKYMKAHADEIQNGLMVAYQFLADLLNAVVTPIIQSLTDFWKEHGETIQNFVSSIYQGLGVVIGGIVNGALTVLKDLVQHVTEFWSEHGDTINNKVKWAYETLLPAVSQAVQGMMDIVLTIVGAITDFWEQHGQEIMQSARTVWDGICNIISGAWAVISNVILPVVGTIFLVVINAFAGIASFISQHASTIQQVMSFAFQTVQTVVSIACSIIGGTIQNVFTIIGGIIKAVGQILTGDFGGAWNTICSTVTSVLSTMWNVTSTVFNSIVSYITSIDWLSLGTNVVQGLIDGITGLASGAWDAICQIGQTIIDGFKSLLGIHSPSTVMAELGRYVIEGLKQGICDAGNFLLGAISQIVGYFTRMKTRIMSTISSLVSGIASKISGMVSSFTSKISSLVSSVGSKLSSMVSSAKAKISSFASSLRAGAMRAKDNVVNAVRTMISRVKSLGSQFLSIGRNMIQGLVNGVKSKASALIQSVTGAVKGAINKAKSLLGIHSPSRVFKSLGINTMEGYNIGVTQEKPKTERAIEHALPNAQDFDMRERIGKIATPVMATTNTSNTNNTNNNNNRTSNDTINFNIQVQDGKSFTMEDAERIFDMLQKVKNKRDLFVY